MHLLIDIGNSTVVVAVTDDSGAIFKTWRYKTLKDQTMAYYRHELYTGSKKYKIDFSQISRVFISSVVPEVNDDIAQAISDLTGVTPLFFSIDLRRGVSVTGGKRQAGRCDRCYMPLWYSCYHHRHGNGYYHQRY